MRIKIKEDYFISNYFHRTKDFNPSLSILLITLTGCY